MKTKEININETQSKEIEKFPNLDLSTECNQRSSNIVAEYQIHFHERRCAFGQRSPEGKLSINIKYEYPNEIVHDGNSLILKCDGKEGTSIIVDIKGQSKITLQVIFCPETIEDCTIPGIDSFSINYTIECNIIDSKPQEPKDINGVVTVKLTPIPVEPKLTLSPASFQYEPKSIDTALEISNSSDLLYAPTTNLQITKIELVDKNGRIIDGAINVGWNNASASKNYSPCTSAIVAINQTPQIVNADHEIENIFPKDGYFISLPLTIDFTKISNPEQDIESYGIIIEYRHHDSKNQRIQNDEKKLIIHVIKNRMKIDLGVNLQELRAIGYQDKAKLCNGDETIVFEPIMVNNEFTNCTYRILVQNTATVIQTEHPDAGIVIHNLSCSGIKFSNGIVAKSNDNQGIDINSLCSTEASEVPQLLRSDGSFISFKFNFVWNSQISHFESSGRKLFATQARAQISFDYFIDETGLQSPQQQQFTHFDGTVVFNLEIEPQREWLGVDFGTSAVVALYGNSLDLQTARSNAQNYLKDLKTIKSKGLKEAYKGKDSNLYSATDEELFINSKIVLGDNFPSGEENVRQFSDYPRGRILFSPGDQFTYSKLLPSLKSLMGYTEVPCLLVADRPLVDKVYEMAYKQLFNLYLSQVSGNRTVEKIVMTYPNTFAAKHVALLKKLAKECLPTLREDYIITVSESDAVAFRYLMKRNEFINNASDDLDKGVLIYDMGAGTLDITYFTNIVENGVRQIDIKGKFGISKAGNYLDYVLAEIVVDIFDQHGITDANNQSFASYISLDRSRSVDIDTCSKLKNYVKDKLKPLLADVDPATNDVTTMMPHWDVLEEDKGNDIPLSEVYEHEKFKTFIDDISTKVIEGCDILFNGGLQKVDTVVFSGRMTSMKVIRNAVMKALRSKSENAVMEFDIAKGNDDSRGQLQERKTAVIEGALNYVESFIRGGNIVLLPQKPFYARYCVITQAMPNQFQVIDLVDNTMGSCNYKFGVRIDLTNIYALYLVQTYAVDEAAIIADFTGDRNLTTVLGSRETTNIHDIHEVTVEVRCQDRETRFEQGTKEVLLWIDGNQSLNLPHDNINSLAFRKSAWPIIY